MSPAQIYALKCAAKRPRRNVLPMLGIRGCIKDALLKALERRGFIAWDGEPWKSVPRITDAGIAAVSEEVAA